MNIDRPKLLTVMVFGVTLSSLFFYPLFSELHDNLFVLQWRRINTMELFCIFLLFSLLAGAVLWLVYKCKNIYYKMLILLIITLVPFMSFLIYLLVQLWGSGLIIGITKKLFIGQIRLISLFAIFVLASGSLFVFIRYARRIVQIVFLILFILSPINILSLWNGIKACAVDSIIFIDNDRGGIQKSSPHKQDSNVLVILFDELSYNYIYEQNKIKPQYENIRDMSLASDIYHNASSPGKDTLTSVMGLITGKQCDLVQMKDKGMYIITAKQKAKLLVPDSNNLFAYAKDAGYKTFCFGPYLPYGELFRQWLDGCRSFSIYNWGSLQKGFKPYSPILTTIVLLPHQFPYGIFKNPVYSLWQKSVTEQIFASVIKAINSQEPFFIFAHFYIPHLPFTFNKNGFYHNSKPFLENDENYYKQLDYVDKLVGNLIAELKIKGKFDNSTIVILADHNYRIMFPGKERTIPLIIKHKGQKTCSNIYNSVKAEDVLKKELFIQ